MPDLSKYFDYNATTPMSDEAQRAWEEANSAAWQNPSSLYREAGAARMRLDECREDLADELGIDVPERIVFTSGATEANNAAIRFLIEQSEKPVAVSAIEHPCVEAVAAPYVESGKVREIPVDPVTGIVDLERLQSWIEAEEISAVSVMAANNETGVLQPWLELAEHCGEYGVRFHTDAAQWLGKLPSDQLGECDFVTG
ncbi:MAG: aminotransferase class V-fold PLP-dependent enzyme, partial [Verrucomicrobiales bacterium]|nr:aminotransferase class V-fold PLP-dependent enzyme [Verrucomicrobiales bacterium]